tara:strand:- start:3271 stop:4437 length:1167 start_codon:yes stop_codon:yes gene_type:complete
MSILSNNEKLDWLRKFVNHNNDDFIHINNKQTIENLKNIFVDFFWIKKIKLYVNVNLSYFPKLISLDFRSQNLCSNDLLNLTHLKHLEYVDLSHNIISSFDIFNISVCNNNLKFLNLSCNRIKTIDIHPNKFKNLEELLLQYNHISEIKSSINNLSNLKVLNLANNHLKNVNHINRISKLEKLYLCGNLLKDLPIDMNKLEKLQILNIQRNMFSDSLPLYRFFQNIDIYIDDYLSILWKSDLKNKSKQISNITIPEEYKCPICYDIMIIPSVNCFGNIYCKECIVTHYENYNTDPLFNTPNNNTNIFPIIFLEKKIKNFIETEFKKTNTNPEINTDNITIVSTTDKFTSSINSSFTVLDSEEDQQQDEFLTQDNISENESIFSEDLSL